METGARRRSACFARSWAFAIASRSSAGLPPRRAQGGEPAVGCQRLLSFRATEGGVLQCGFPLLRALGQLSFGRCFRCLCPLAGARVARGGEGFGAGREPAFGLGAER